MAQTAPSQPPTSAGSYTSLSKAVSLMLAIIGEAKWAAQRGEAPLAGSALEPAKPSSAHRIAPALRWHGPVPGERCGVRAAARAPRERSAASHSPKPGINPRAGTDTSTCIGHAQPSPGPAAPAGHAWRRPGATMPTSAAWSRSTRLWRAKTSRSARGGGGGGARPARRALGGGSGGRTPPCTAWRLAADAPPTHSPTHPPVRCDLPAQSTIKVADALLKKYKDDQLVRALKAIAVARAGRHIAGTVAA